VGRPRLPRADRPVIIDVEPGHRDRAGVPGRAAPSRFGEPPRDRRNDPRRVL
jgi:hypothetical protein